MSNPERSWQPLVTRWFFVYRTLFYVGIAFLARESVVPVRSEGPAKPIEVRAKRDQREALWEFAAWSATFASRLERAMPAGTAE